MAHSVSSGEVNGSSLVVRSYRLGGMAERGAGDEVADTMKQIDGVKQVNVDTGSRGVTIQFDSGQVTEDHLVSTLNSLGHSILEAIEPDVVPQLTSTSE